MEARGDKEDKVESSLGSIEQDHISKVYIIKMINGLGLELIS